MGAPPRDLASWTANGTTFTRGRLKRDFRTTPTCTSSLVSVQPCATSVSPISTGVLLSTLYIGPVILPYKTHEATKIKRHSNALLTGHYCWSKTYKGPLNYQTRNSVVLDRDRGVTDPFSKRSVGASQRKVPVLYEELSRASRGRLIEPRPTPFLGNLPETKETRQPTLSCPSLVRPGAPTLGRTGTKGGVSSTSYGRTSAGSGRLWGT